VIKNHKFGDNRTRDILTQTTVSRTLAHNHIKVWRSRRHLYMGEYSSLEIRLWSNTLERQ